MTGPEGVHLVHGIDLVEVERIAGLLAAHPDRFAFRCFTEAERDWADGGRSLRAQRYAGRFAVKEAVLKALGTGQAEGIRWTDVATRAAPSGAPELELGGGAAARAARLGITAWSISITHAAGLAVASAVGWRR